VSALLLVLSVAGSGCGGGEDDGAVSITVWAHQGQERENAAMRSIVDAFNAAHADENLRIDITFFPDRQYAEKVAIAARTGGLPDVLDIDGPYVGPWAADGLIVPLGDHVDAELRADLLPSLIEQGTYEDQLYALGAFDSALVVYYNRDMVAAAGIEPPQTIADAWTWEEFTAALAQVRPHAPQALALHTDQDSDEWYTYAFSPLIWSNGGQLIDTENEQVVGVLDSERNVAAVRRWQALFEQGFAEPNAIEPDPFSKKLVAFDWTGHWMLPTFEAQEDLDFGVMPLPKMGQEFVAPSGSWCWGISRDADDPARAFGAIAWFLDPEEGIKPIVAANGAVPGRQSAFALFPEYDEMPRKLFREQLLEAAHPRPRTAVYLRLTREFGTALREIATGVDVAERLQAAAQAVQDALERRR
jgi:ABC-type glycerol-3-phosphate transport system substrate-binding protein